MPTNRFTSVILTLTADVANAGTFTAAYPSGSVQADFLAPNVNTADEVMIVNDNDRWDGTKVDFAYGASLVTVTNNTGTTLKAGSKVQLQLAKATGISYFGPKAPTFAALTAATGTPSDTIADVTASFSQSILNNNIKSLADKINLITAALKAAGIVA
jgi:hypothetical protein